MTTTPNINIPYVPENTLDPAAGLNLALNVIDALLQTAVIDMGQTAPPGSPNDGDLHIVGTGATGAWAGQDNNLARYVAEGDFWQFYEAGVEVHYVINRDDGNLYKFIEGSPVGSWVLAAGLGDAPADGQRYVRRDAAWETLAGLTVQDTDSPPTVDEDEVHTIIVGAGLKVVPVSPGVVMFNNAFQYAPVIDVPDQHTDALAGVFGNYMRFTHAAAEFHFSSDEPWEIGAEYHGRYAGAGTLTITADSGFTINPPAGGSLVIPPGGTFTVKIVAADEADLFGVTEDA